MWDRLRGVDHVDDLTDEFDFEAALEVAHLDGFMIGDLDKEAWKNFVDN